MRQRGFTYLGLLFAIAFIGLLLAGTGEVWHTTLKREREAELLFVGRQYARAIAAYHAATPGDAKQWPKHLEDLLEDRRNPAIHRHLRRLYSDPFTGKPEWGLIKSGEFIVGVHSLGEGKPLKQSGFLPEEEGFAGAASHRDWRFLAQAGIAPGQEK
jgi:type II secretory pathway pseudopilin PulG